MADVGVGVTAEGSGVVEGVQVDTAGTGVTGNRSRAANLSALDRCRLGVWWALTVRPIHCCGVQWPQ